jgi:hypothetical protein
VDASWVCEIPFAGGAKSFVGNAYMRSFSSLESFFQRTFQAAIDNSCDNSC